MSAPKFFEARLERSYPPAKNQAIDLKRSLPSPKIHARLLERSFGCAKILAARFEPAFRSPHEWRPQLERAAIEP